MKTTLTIVLALLISTISFAQQGINYKAAIKDNNGNVVANQNITVQFTILKGTAQTNVYQETHTPTADANGIIIVNIGEGTTSDDFSSIDWGSDDHYLNVQIDTGSGLTDLGTTQFMAVPYALNTKNTAFTTKNGVTSNSPGNIADDNFVFGSNQLDYSGDEYGGLDDKRMFFNKNKGAFRAGTTSVLSTGPDGLAWNDANIGKYSFASGKNTIASGESSTAMGIESRATKYGAQALGTVSRALGNNSIAIGTVTNALGEKSTAMGYGTTASSYASTAIGSYNNSSGNPTSWVATDPLFQIGNGRGFSPLIYSNALTVLKNGNTGIGTDTPSTKLQVTGGTDASVNNSSGYVVIGEESGTNVVMDNNEIMARYNGAISTLSINANGGNVFIGGKVGIGTATSGSNFQVLSTGESEKAIYGKAAGQSGEAIYGEATGLYGKGIHAKVTSTHSSANAILAVSGGGDSYAGYFIGTVHVSGDIKYTGTITDVSDRRLKENLEPVNNVLGQLQNIKGYTYNMKDDADKTREYGVMAQDVQKEFPEMVKVIDDEGHLGVSYIQLIPVMLEGIKEQQATIDSQQKQIDKLKTMVTTLINNQ